MRAYDLTTLVFCTLLPFAASAPAPAAANASVRQPPAIGGDFELNGTRGKSFLLSSQRGKVVLVFFGYTGCPDVWYTDLLQLRDIIALLGGRRDGVQVVFISEDPGRDTRERMAEYVAAFSSAILRLTGSEARLRRVAKAYGTHFSYTGRTTGSTTYTVDHPAILYVVDAVGKLARLLPYGTPASDLIQAIAPMIE